MCELSTAQQCKSLISPRHLFSRCVREDWKKIHGKKKTSILVRTVFRNSRPCVTKLFRCSTARQGEQLLIQHAMSSFIRKSKLSNIFNPYPPDISRLIVSYTLKRDKMDTSRKTKPKCCHQWPGNEMKIALHVSRQFLFEIVFKMHYNSIL